MKAPAAFDINLLGIKSLGFSPPSPPFTNINLHNTEHRSNSVYFLFFRHIFSNISLDLVYPTEVTSQNFPISINPISVITYAICPHAVNHNVELLLIILLFFFFVFFFYISFLDSSPSFFPPHPPFFLLSFILELRILHDY